MSRLVFPNPIACIVLVAVCGILISCGSNQSSVTGQPIPNIAGPWEFIAFSSAGTVTGIDVALAEGQVLVNGMQQPDGQITASSAQMAFVSLDPASENATAFGGNCLPVTSVNSLGPGTVTSLDAPMNFTFTENGSVFDVTATLSGDGKSILNGTYSAQAANACSDPGGTITGAVVSKLAGTYSGQMCPPASSSCQTPTDFTDNATATVSENSSSVLTLSLVLTGTDNTNFTLSGPVTGNAVTLQGTFQAQTLTYNGYFEPVYNSSLQSNVPSLYLVNATNPAQPAYVGTLSVPQI
jgi:hypothetical protein